MNPPTVIIANLIPRLRETVAQHLKAYLGGEGELSSILESIEFWYDRIRDKEHPDLPMWSDLSSRDSDQLFDAWIEAVEDFWKARLTKSALPIATPVRYEKRSDGLIHEAPCPECGIVGTHFCTGGQPPHPGWSASYHSLPVSSHSGAPSNSPLSSPLEQVKTSQEAPVCEVEQLREVSYGIIKQICRSLHALGAPIGVLAAVGSWGDTLEESEVLELLEAENARLVPQVTGSDCVTLPRVVVEEVEKTLGTAFSFVDGFSGPKSEKLNKAISSALSSLRASLKPQA
jgi:hypothetical protein